MKHHIKSGVLPEKNHTIDDIKKILPSQANLVTFSRWMKIDDYEVKAGQGKKVREKILSKAEMLKVSS